jgi:hypothetical protein
MFPWRRKLGLSVRLTLASKEYLVGFALLCVFNLLFGYLLLSSIYMKYSHTDANTRLLLYQPGDAGGAQRHVMGK